MYDKIMQYILFIIYIYIYLDHTWKTTLAGEYAPPAILDQKPEGSVTGHHWTLNVFSCREIEICLMSFLSS